MALDEIGNWSVDKLNILREYSKQYSLILKHQQNPRTGGRLLTFGYIDAFAGAGEHLHKTTGETIKGSPLNALELPFDEYDLIELDPERVERLKKITAEKTNVRLHHGDCNEVLLRTVLPNYQHKNYRRALCFLDPYNLQLSWDIIHTAGQMKSIEIFLNFPVHDMNRNAKRKNLNDVSQKTRERMTRFWGDASWHEAMFAQSTQSNFLDQLGSDGTDLEKNDNDAFVKAFQKRMKEVGGFEYVPDPAPMRNSRQAVVYYLFFASNNPVGNRIANAILKPYRQI